MTAQSEFRTGAGTGETDSADPRNRRKDRLFPQLRRGIIYGPPVPRRPASRTLDHHTTLLSTNPDPMTMGLPVPGQPNRVVRLLLLLPDLILRCPLGLLAPSPGCSGHSTTGVFSEFAWIKTRVGCNSRKQILRVFQRGISQSFCSGTRALLPDSPLYSSHVLRIFLVLLLCATRTALSLPNLDTLYLFRPRMIGVILSACSLFLRRCLLFFSILDLMYPGAERGDDHRYLSTSINRFHMCESRPPQSQMGLRSSGCPDCKVSSTVSLGSQNERRTDISDPPGASS